MSIDLPIDMVAPFAACMPCSYGRCDEGMFILDPLAM